MQSQPSALILTLLAIAAAAYVSHLPECGPNEEGTDCVDGDCGVLCSQMGESFSCPAGSCSNTTIACVCKKGYLRAGSPTSACVPESECSCYNDSIAIKCGPHQVPTDNYNACGTLCSQVGQKINCPLETGGIRGCECESGYARATTATSICVPESECPKNNCSVNHLPECGPNQVPTDNYTACGSLCSQVGHVVHCPLQGTNGTRGCRCKDGYARATTATSICVPTSDCSKYNCSTS